MADRPRPSLSTQDERRAFGVVTGTQKRATRKYRCNACGVSFPADELVPDLDSEGRRIGFVCDGCA